MRTFFVSLGILGGVLLLGSVRADQPGDARTTDTTGPKTQQTPADSMLPGDYVGRLVSVNAKNNEVVLQITTQRQVLKNPNGPTRTADQIAQDLETGIGQIGQIDRDNVVNRSLADYQRKRQEMEKAVTKFQLGLQKQLNEMQAQQNNPQPIEYITLTERKDVPLKAAKEVKVRLRDLPTIDEEGRVHNTYTSEEIRLLKGKDPFQPGFDGKLGNLNAGEYVRVTLAPKAAEKKGDDSKTEGRGNRTEITSIIVISKEQAEKQPAPRP